MEKIWLSDSRDVLRKRVSSIRWHLDPSAEFFHVYSGLFIFFGWYSPNRIFCWLIFGYTIFSWDSAKIRLKREYYNNIYFSCSSRPIVMSVNSFYVVNSALYLVDKSLDKILQNRKQVNYTELNRIDCLTSNSTIRSKCYTNLRY